MKSMIILLAISALATASDIQCTSNGGSCLDMRYYKCTAGYENGQCDGDEYRQCCANCNSVCLANEASYQNGDGECDDSGGICMDNSNYCSGDYYNGMCGGPSSRKCCLTSGGNGCYGNIKNVDTTGASCQTASQDNLFVCGVSASNKMAETDYNNMGSYKNKIETAASDLCMDASVIAGIISRETRAGTALDADGYGADGHGYGLMQVDDRYHKTVGGPYSLAHIEQGTGILIDMINGVQASHPTWTQDMALKGGISAYNAGVSNVQSYDNMDVGTTGGDYANDVTARSQYYKSNGY